VGKFKQPKSKASKAPVPMYSHLVDFMLAWREKTLYPKDNDYVFPTVKLGGKKPLSASIMVQKYLRPAAVKAGVIASDWKGSLRFSISAFTGNRTGEGESGSEYRAGCAASRGLRDDYAAVCPVRHGARSVMGTILHL